MGFWGIGCGQENVPGAYVAIPDQLCFIEWATKCEHGNLYHPYVRIFHLVVHRGRNKTTVTQAIDTSIILPKGLYTFTMTLLCFDTFPG